MFILPVFGVKPHHHALHSKIMVLAGSNADESCRHYSIFYVLTIDFVTSALIHVTQIVTCTAVIMFEIPYHRARVYIHMCHIYIHTRGVTSDFSDQRFDK